MTQHVIVGTDGSESAREAIRTAARLAALLDSTLHLICAYEKFEVTTVREGGDEIHIATDLEALAIAESEAGRLADSGIRVIAEAAQGKPAEALIRAAHEHDANLIVVGNKRVQGMARLLGSIASSVAAKAPCDVYIAHTQHVAR